MIIDVDMGNTRLKWRVYGQTEVHVCSDWHSALKDWMRMFAVTRVRVSSVLGAEVERDFRQAVKVSLGVVVEFAKVADNIGGLKLAYQDIDRLGTDRWLTMLAARNIKSTRSWLVISAGTALTADFVANDGRHLGGYIVPGLQLGFDALMLKTAKIGQITNVVKKNWQPGGSTLECVQGGLSVMYQAYCSELVSQACTLLVNPCVAWSGGSASELMKLVQGQSEMVLLETLVLDGLSITLP